MNSYGGLAFTGTGVVIGGVVLGQAWLLAIAVGLVLVGMMCVRLGWRRGKTISDR